MGAVKKIGGEKLPTSSDYGGKGRALDELAHLSELDNVPFQVPGGFLVHTDVYDDFVSQIDTERLLDTYDSSFTNAERNDYIREVEKTFLNADFPEKYESEIDESIKELNWVEDGKKIGVRSAAQAEDGDDAWAGQLESEIHVAPSLEDFKQAAKMVYASGWMPQALDYAKTDQIAGSIGLVVQEMVDPVSGGVIHSKENGKPDTISILEAPDPWQAVEPGKDDTVYGSIFLDRDLTLSDQQELEGLVNYKAEDADTPYHSMEQVRQLRSTAEIVEDVYGWDVEAVDIEFAYDQNGDLMVLQSRPYHGNFSAEPEFDLTDVRSEDIICETEINQNPGRMELPAVVVEDPENGVGQEPDQYALVAETLPPPLIDQVSWDSVEAMVISRGQPGTHAGTAAGDQGVTWLGWTEDDPVEDIEDGEIINVEANGQRGQAFRGDYEWS